MVETDGDWLAVLGGFVKLPPDAPHGAGHAAFRLCHAIARMGRWKAIDVFHENVSRQRAHVVLPEGVATRLLERARLSRGDRAYAAIYAPGEQTRYPPHLLRADHIRAPVVCEVGTAHSPAQWTNLFWSSWTGALRATDGFIFKSRFAEALFRNVWEPWQGRAEAPAFPVATVIPNGVDLQANRRDEELRAQTRRQLGLADGDVAFLTFSRLSPGTKGDYRALIFLWKRLIETHRQAVLILSGKNIDRSFLFHLRASARQAGLGNNLIIAEDPYEVWTDARERLMSAADVFVHLSTGTEEVSSNSTLEAMAFGLPVIGAHWAGLPDMVENGSNGFLIPTLFSDPSPTLQRTMLARDAGNVGTALALQVACDGDAFVQAASALCDPQTRLEMGNQSRRRAEAAFALDDVAKRRVSFLDEISRQAHQGGTQPTPTPRDLVSFRAVLQSMGKRPLSPQDLLTVSRPDGFAFVREAPFFAHDAAAIAAIEIVLRRAAPLTVAQLVHAIEALGAPRPSERPPGQATHRTCTRILVALIAYGVVSVAVPKSAL